VSIEPYFKTQLGRLYCGDSLEVLKQLPSGSVDVVVTSPPYWSKRDYGDATCKVWGGDPNCEHEWEPYDGVVEYQIKNERRKVSSDFRSAFCKKCGAWYGQLGLEPTPEMFVEHLIEIFREVKRVLKDTGSLFVVIDDSYLGSMQGFGATKPSKTGFQWTGDGHYAASRGKPPTAGFTKLRKSMALVPELFAIKMVYEEGWILREKIIWSKKVHFYKDKTTYGNAMPESVKDRFCHTWEYIYHFTKSQKYYFDLDALRVPYRDTTIKRFKYPVGKFGGNPSQPDARLGKGISGGSDATYVEPHPLGANPGDVVCIPTRPFSGAHFAVFPPEIPEVCIKATCPPEGVVLDPFAGAGTTLVVAEKMGRRWIGIEINPEYCELIKRRFKKELGKQYSTRRLIRYFSRGGGAYGTVL